LTETNNPDADALVRRMCVFSEKCIPVVPCSRCWEFYPEFGTHVTELIEAFEALACRAPHFTRERLAAWESAAAGFGPAPCPCSELEGFPAVDCAGCPAKGIGFNGSGTCPAGNLFVRLDRKIPRETLIDVVRGVWEKALREREKEAAPSG